MAERKYPSNLAGQLFGRLIVLRQAFDNECTESQLRAPMTKWLCRCACDHEIIALRSHLVTGQTTSCGCSRKGQKRPGILGKSRGDKRIKNIWQAMQARCYLPSHKYYYRYGGRGIKICDDWKDSFDTFHQWMLSQGYTDELTIDRHSNDGDYTPDNCHLITLKEQQSNKDNTIKCESGLSLKAECEKRGLNYNTIRMRYKNGYKLEEALGAKPVNKFYYGGKTMDEWCEIFKFNTSKVKTRMCRHKESFKDALLHYAVEACDQRKFDAIRNMVSTERDEDKTYYKSRSD